jgi:glycosyltransferase involved in cell wall biosynthesis
MKISLVIPVRDEEKTLADLIDSVRRLTRPPDEVVLVDGGSEDGTVRLARELVGGDARFRLVEPGPASPGRGRNVGIREASHDWVALTDAGVRLEPDWLERLAAAAERDPEVEVVYGNFEPLVRTFSEECFVLAYCPPRVSRGGVVIRGPFIASSLMRRSVWAAVGGFPDLRAAEDQIFMRRVAQGGFRVAWEPSATVWWEVCPDLRSAYRKFSLYSRVNAAAGEQAYWHHGVLRKYLAALPFLALAAAHSRWWLAAPVLGALARPARGIWARREGRGLAWALNPVRFLGVAVFVYTLDLATFVGWARASLDRPLPAGEAGPLVI